MPSAASITKRWSSTGGNTMCTDNAELCMKLRKERINNMKKEILMWIAIAITFGFVVRGYLWMSEIQAENNQLVLIAKQYKYVITKLMVKTQTPITQEELTDAVQNMK
jgi:D-alanyl-lipoteichoic acid acyltransferase DltB (MBOAT superfamily)